MTVQFFCPNPNCYAILDFDSNCIGQRAKCEKCGQSFIIPEKNLETPQKVNTPKPLSFPEPGFYKAAIADSWKVFIQKENATMLVFVIAAICFKFFLSKAICCVGDISHLVVWGWLMGFYLNVISESAFDGNALPEIELGTNVTFLWNIIKPILIFLYTLFITLLPFIISISILQSKGITEKSMWQTGIGLHTIPQILLITGLFTFPMAVLTTAIAKDLALLRPDYLIAPILKAFKPYLLVAALLTTTAVMIMLTSQFDISDPLIIITAKLAFNLAVQAIAIIAMRTIGLFYKHYGCYMKW